MIDFNDISCYYKKICCYNEKNVVLTRNDIIFYDITRKDVISRYYDIIEWQYGNAAIIYAVNLNVCVTFLQQNKRISVVV